MAKILIVGFGNIGTRLAKRLVDFGHNVTGLRRNAPENPHPKIKSFVADITRKSNLAWLETNFDHLFFAVSADRRDEAHYRAVYDLGLKNLLDKFSGNACKPQWFFISSTSVYGQTNGEWIDEDSPTKPKNETGKIILQAEKVIIAESADNIVVRFSGIYGPDRTRLIRRTKHGEPIQMDPPYYTNRIHQEDCADVLDFLLAKKLEGKLLDRCYIASDDEPAPILEVVSWLANELRCPQPPPKVMKGTISQNKRCSNLRLKSIGYSFQYPTYKEGYLPLIRSFRKG